MPMRRGIFHILVIASLTILTQLGGIAWAAALLFRRRVLVFVLFYVALGFGAYFAAPLMGRVALSCWDSGALRVHSIGYCAMNRHYVSPELASVLQDAADEMARRHPGTVTLVLDANFPFGDGFPLIPHLSHDDGEKADLAFYYQGAQGYEAGRTKSPFGYFAFEAGPSDCTRAWPSLRWDFAWAQRFWRDIRLEPERTAEVIEILARDPRVGKVFVEPHLQDRLGVFGAKIRFQGCRAARHDDHIHVQL